MFYIRTADKLQRTARWLENLPGGLKYLQEVILEDKLGICASLESQMKELVDSYFDEWATAVSNPAISARFTQFDNSPDAMQGVELEQDRGQDRPAYWAKAPAKDDFKALSSSWSSTAWEAVLPTSHFSGADDLPNGISATIKRGDTQLAVWRIRGRFFATQQMCPHKRAFVLSDGLIGESKQEKTASDEPPSSSSSSSSSPWVSCPHHKRNFDLGNGSCRNDAELSIATFEVEERPDGMVYLLLPPVEELDAALGTKKWMVRKGESGEAPFAELDRKLNPVGTRGRKPNMPVKMDGPGMKMQIAAGGGCGMAPDW
jgi:nitrite reductase (NAD(P)H)